MRWRQILLDANVLVLYIVGRIDKGLIGSHRRLREYVEIDFDVLMLVLKRSNKIVTTANIMTEVSNLLETGKEERPNKFLQELHNVVLETEEIVVKSADACQVDGFTRVGLSDAALLLLAGPESPIITVDNHLYGRANALNPHSAFNFWHLREQYLAKRKKLRTG